MSTGSSGKVAVEGSLEGPEIKPRPTTISTIKESHGLLSLSSWLCLFCCWSRVYSIATDYGLEGSGSNSGGDEIFRPFRPTLGPTKPPVKWVPGLSRG